MNDDFMFLMLSECDTSFSMRRLCGSVALCFPSCFPLPFPLPSSSPSSSSLSSSSSQFVHLLFSFFVDIKYVRLQYSAQKVASGQSFRRGARDTLEAV